ncbi:ATP-binding cassette domain-containing protein [Coprobacillaceae bacterium CR2/5/TPMF4]|nr:ATP-binding cassette domain-containing protein [Coprobacillaceae bacterium CR2/5/TPMF4]
MADNILVKVDNVSKHFHTAGGVVKAVNNVSFEIAKGETVGLVGESGCGKSTLGRTLMGIYQPTEGKIYFNNEEINIKKLKIVINTLKSSNDLPRSICFIKSTYDSRKYYF